MRLVLIVIFGLIAISATYAWSNISTGQAQANKIDQVLKPSLKQAISQSPTHTTTTTTTTSTSTAIASPAIPVTPVAIDGHATTLDAARITARSSVGKADPFTPLEPSISDKDLIKSTTKTPLFGNGLSVPPPPPGVVNPFGTANESRPGQLGSGLELGELPNPPDNAGINHKIELVGIVGDRAIFSIKDNLLRRRHHWPKSFTLATGQSFENLKLTAIKDESVVVEEDGQTFSKLMPPIK
ncbi:hypothetical protein BH11CYA1_BH11CYA1_06060 [soil metagenome]